jgi:hypothetical protein
VWFLNPTTKEVPFVCGILTLGGCASLRWRTDTVVLDLKREAI